MAIDVHKALARNGLKKTGDKMIAGDLELFRDATSGLQAVTFQQMSTAVRGAAIHRPWPSSGTVGQWYGATFPTGSAIQTGPTGFNSAAMIHPVFVGGTVTWDKIGGSFQYTSSPGTPNTWNFLIFALDPLTLMPTTLRLRQQHNHIIDATLRWHEENISLQTTDVWLGIGWEYDLSGGELIAVNACNGIGGATFTSGTDNVGYAPYGLSMTSAENVVPVYIPIHMLVASFGNHQAPTTGLPVGGAQAGDFVIDGSNNALENGRTASSSTGVYLRRAA